MNRRSCVGSAGKPVVLRDGAGVHAPSPLPEPSWSPAAKKIAAVVAVTAAVTGCKGIEVSDQPRAVAPMPTEAAPPAPAESKK